MAKGKADLFVNMAFGSVLESAANTLTFSEIQTGLSIFEKVAWVIHRIQYYSYSLGLLLAEEDTIMAALVVSNKLSALDLSDPAVIDMVEWGVLYHGTPANATDLVKPMERDFTTLPGGGLIIPPRPLYVAGIGNSLASASSTYMRIFFTHKALSADEYWELVEARRMVE